MFLSKALYGIAVLGTLAGIASASGDSSHSITKLSGHAALHALGYSGENIRKDNLRFGGWRKDGSALIYYGPEMWEGHQNHFSYVKEPGVCQGFDASQQTSSAPASTSASTSTSNARPAVATVPYAYGLTSAPG